MKPLNNMDGVDKARLLHTLFPEEIPDFLQFVSNVCHDLIENAETGQADWKQELLSFEQRQEIVADAKRSIDRYAKLMAKRAVLFSDHLFDAQKALFMQYCLELYTQVRKHQNIRFTYAVWALFNLNNEKAKINEDEH